MVKAKVKLWSKDTQKLEELCRIIKEEVEKRGAIVKGPIPLPTKKLKLWVMRQVKTGTGHGNAKFDKWELRIHKRLIEIGECDRALQYLMRIPIPDEVNIEIKLKE